MSSKYIKPDIAPTSLNKMYRSDIPEDFELPSCGFEDVDRAVFKLFNEQLPLFYKKNGQQEKVPVIFAGGERAFILKRSKPHTDRSGALILPLVSIIRTTMDQQPTAGGGSGVGPGDGDMVISKRKISDSIDFFNEENEEGLLNQTNVVNSNKHVGPSSRGYRRNLGGAVIKNDNDSPVIEIITMPAPRYFTVTYDVTIWAQYLQQMNDLLEAIMSSYNHNPSRTFKLDTDKGYWFVGFVDSPITPDINFDSMTDSERIVKYNLSISVNGYIINPRFPGSQTSVRRTLSAPRISFDTKFSNIQNKTVVGVPSPNLDHYIDSDFETTDEPLPGRAIGGTKIPFVGPPSSGVNPVEGIVDATGFSSATIGNFSTEDGAEYVRLESYIDPFTGERKTKRVIVKTKQSRHGETLHKLIRITD